MQIKKTIEDILKKVTNEYEAEAKLIIEAISGQSAVEILIEGNIKNQDKIIEVAKKRAETGMPIQQILGFSYFMGEKFTVNQNVLIPRDETELLVLKTLEVSKKMNNPKILDIGVGTGCISCMLAKKMGNIPFEILGVDISTSALKIAFENVLKMGLEKKVLLRKSDIFSNIKEKFDIIVSNPPYIKEGEILQNELKFEPQNALFAKNDGYYFYEEIIKNAPNYLNKNGFLLFEIGFGQDTKICQMLNKNFSNIEIFKDMAGINRVIRAKF